MRICSIGSGSKGNGTLVETESGCLLVDCGFGLKDTLARLESKGVHHEQLKAVLVTHEHSDHSKGVAMLARKLCLPLYMSSGTYQALIARDLLREDDLVNILTPDEYFELLGLKILAVPVPHDARETFQFIFNNETSCFGLLTDVGFITAHLREVYSQCDCLFLEFNHDLDMLWAGSYPDSLKERVGGNLGHLNNQQAMDLLLSLDQQRLKTLVVTHVSEKNNDIAQVDQLIKQRFDSVQNTLVYASQQSGCDWIDTTAQGNTIAIKDSHASSDIKSPHTQSEEML